MRRPPWLRMSVANRQFLRPPSGGVLQSFRYSTSRIIPRRPPSRHPSNVAPFAFVAARRVLRRVLRRVVLRRSIRCGSSLRHFRILRRNPRRVIRRSPCRGIWSTFVNTSRHTSRTPAAAFVVVSVASSVEPHVALRLFVVAVHSVAAYVASSVAAHVASFDQHPLRNPRRATTPRQASRHPSRHPSVAGAYVSSRLSSQASSSRSLPRHRRIKVAAMPPAIAITNGDGTTYHARLCLIPIRDITFNRRFYRDRISRLRAHRPLNHSAVCCAIRFLFVR